MPTTRRLPACRCGGCCGGMDGLTSRSAATARRMRAPVSASKARPPFATMRCTTRVVPAFMQAVQPRYAIPFASNHCYLHPDTEKFNDFAVNPLRLREQIDQLGGLDWSGARGHGARFVVAVGSWISLGSTAGLRESRAVHRRISREQMGTNRRQRRPMNCASRFRVPSGAGCGGICSRIPRWRRR